MPIMSGIEATLAIRKLEAGSPAGSKRAYIIALTGLAGAEPMEEAYSAGVGELQVFNIPEEGEALTDMTDNFLTKPVSFSVVAKELEHWYEHEQQIHS